MSLLSPDSGMSDTAPPKGRVKKYHKRSLWACDECKLRKKKCDGNHPCKTCNLYQKDCTYESRTRPSQPPTQRIRELEDDVRSMRSLLGRLKSDLSRHNLLEVERMLSDIKPAAKESPHALLSPSPAAKTPAASEALRSMLVGRGRLLRSGSRTFFHGPYSGPAVICAVLEFFEPKDPEAMHARVIDLFDMGRVNPGLGASHLPEKPTAVALFNIVLTQTHPFFQFLDSSTLETLLRNVYDDPQPFYTEHYMSNLALCHAVLALGYTLDISEHHTSGCESPMSQAHEQFLASRRVLDLTAIDDLTRLKTVLCTVVFLICKSWLSSAYTYVSIAATSAIKQGLHVNAGTSIPSGNGKSPRPAHDQLLTTLVNIDLFVSTVLGLPPLINLETAGTALEATRESAHSALPRSQGFFGDHTWRHNVRTTPGDLALKYYQIVSLTASVLWGFSSASPSAGQQEDAAVSEIDTLILRNAEKDLSVWTKDIGIALSPSSTDTDDVPINTSIIRHELELSFYWSQLLLYLPFLHYLRPLADGKYVPESLSRPALTCLKIAVNTIVRCEALLTSLSDSESYTFFMHPANWTCVYTLFLAVLALIFLISIHDGTSRPSKAWLKAETGIKILTALKCSEGGAGPCLAVLMELVQQLNYTVDFDMDEIERTTQRVCQRRKDHHHDTQLSTPDVSMTHAGQVPHHQYQDVSTSSEHAPPRPAQEDSGMLSSADGMLAQAQEMLTTNEVAASKRHKLP